jgi:hypothetical protein
MMEAKVFYDQSKLFHPVYLEANVIGEGDMKKMYYIYTKEQFMDEWLTDNHFPVTRKLE